MSRSGPEKVRHCRKYILERELRSNVEGLYKEKFKGDLKIFIGGVIRRREQVGSLVRSVIGLKDLTSRVG